MSSDTSSTLQFFHPDSVDEAHALLSRSALPVDSPTQRRIRSDDNLGDYLASGRRRPEWVWGVRRDDDPTVLGVVGGFGTHGIFLLDVFGVPEDPDVAKALVARATEDALADHDPVEVCLFAPAGSTMQSESLAPLVGPLTGAGWRLLVERRHYEFEPAPDLAADAETELSFERLTDAEDPRLAACHREIMRETLDAHDHDLVERLGFDAACAESLGDLVGDQPVDRIHLATDPAGTVVGMVAGFVHPNGRGVLWFVGVAHDHRGHGYGRQLLAWQTRRLLEDEATVLIADTDNDNVPMARAFAEVGWPQTETRIDLVPGPR
ncbi:MAG: GNAT family N-acetyltransferase [Nocardioides sp.]